MYAVVETGGKQVRVKEGDTIRVERLAAVRGDEVTLDRILLVGNGKTEIGAPVVAGATVRARVLRQGRGRKVRVMKYRAKAHYRRRQGHRQAFTELRIEKIEVGGQTAVIEKATEEKAERTLRPRRRKTPTEGAGGA